MQVVKRWFPAFLMMSLIFLISSQPSGNLPNFEAFDEVVKKGGHMIGYGLLAVFYLQGLTAGRDDLKWGRGSFWLAWLLALIYAFTDEYHQSFVKGRSPSIWDVIIFDNLGALIALLLYCHLTRNHRNARPLE